MSVRTQNSNMPFAGLSSQLKKLLDYALDMNHREHLPFLLGFSVFIISEVFLSSMLVVSFGTTIPRLLLYSAFVLMIVSEWLYSGFRISGFSSTELKAVVLIAIVCISGFVTRSVALIVTALAIFEARHEDIDQVVLVAVMCQVLCCAVILILAATGVLQDYVWVQRGGARIRHGLGFRYATHLSKWLFFSFCGVFFLYRGRVPIRLSAVVVALAAIVYLLTDTRNSFILTILLGVGSLLIERVDCKRFFQQSKRRLAAMGAIFPALAVLSFALTIGYSPDTPIMRTLDSISGRRLSISHNTLADVDVTVFGNDIELLGNGISYDNTVRKEGEKATFVDNTYVNLLVYNGVAILGLFVMVMSCLMLCFVKHNELHCLFIFLLFAAFSLFDPDIAQLHRNFFLLLAGTELIGGRNRQM